MFIPKSYESISQTIKVIEVDDLGLEAGALGRCYFDQNLIKIQNNTKSFPLTKDQRLKTYYHEFVHMMFHAAQKPELRDDEALVDLVADLLYQHEKTKVK